uniref:Uncharacterized protein n=1 Tax=Anguilla anguilla TaxID=7936 RepID=A0A0E9T692_ANGAN
MKDTQIIQFYKSLNHCTVKIIFTFTMRIRSSLQSTMYLVDRCVLHFESLDCIEQISTAQL